MAVPQWMTTSPDTVLQHLRDVQIGSTSLLERLEIELAHYLPNREQIACLCERDAVLTVGWFTVTNEQWTLTAISIEVEEVAKTRIPSLCAFLIGQGLVPRTIGFGSDAYEQNIYFVSPLS
jgi:hypothetical protein